jgi:hypothetical protein
MILSFRNRCGRKRLYRRRRLLDQQRRRQQEGRSPGKVDRHGRQSVTGAVIAGPPKQAYFALCRR